LDERMIEWRGLEGGAKSRSAGAGSEARLTAMWRAREGGMVSCLSCAAAPLALEVGFAEYRWSCAPCGWRSHWFRVLRREVHVESSLTEDDEAPPTARGPFAERRSRCSPST
jgi:hypothetical protein